MEGKRGKGYKDFFCLLTRLQHNYISRDEYCFGCQFFYILNIYNTYITFLICFQNLGNTNTKKKGHFCNQQGLIRQYKHKSHDNIRAF